MQLEHEFVVPVPVKQAWDVLLDIERIAPCMPGATLDRVEGDAFDGRVKVKVGPIAMTYKGTARFLKRDEEARHVTIQADGRDSRGSGTAAATINARLHEEGERTRVTVQTDLAVTGRPAQFGRGVMVDVSNKLLGQFGDCLERTLAAPPPAVTSEPAASEPAAAEPAAAEPAAAEAIDLLGVAGAPVLRRVIPVVIAATGLLVLLWRVLRSRSDLPR